MDMEISDGYQCGLRIKGTSLLEVHNILSGRCCHHNPETVVYIICLDSSRNQPEYSLCKIVSF